MADALLSSMRERLRETRLTMVAAQKAERRARSQFEGHRIELDALIEAVRASTAATCDCASLALAFGTLQRLADYSPDDLDARLK